MARPSTGQVVIREHGNRRVFALRFGAHGQRHYVILGSPQEGWTKAKAEVELQRRPVDEASRAATMRRHRRRRSRQAFRLHYRDLRISQHLHRAKDARFVKTDGLWYLRPSKGRR